MANVEIDIQDLTDETQNKTQIYKETDNGNKLRMGKFNGKDDAEHHCQDIRHNEFVSEGNLDFIDT